MKKVLIGIVTLCMGLSVLFGCQMQALPVPEYPLDEDTIAEALQDRSASYTIIEDDWTREESEGQSQFNLYLPQSDKLFAIGILS